jgi:1-acyl-sn-glycerol-3-phosphate acyltransferase
VTSRSGSSAALWAMGLVARLLTAVACRLRVSGEVPESLRRGPLLLAVNHIGVFDPVAVFAACRALGLTPRMMATAGLFRAPVVGAILRSAGMIRVDRRTPRVAVALTSAERTLSAGAVVAVYPEGRIGLDPGLWPERGKTGLARLALETGVPVVPVAQWGAHEVMVWHGWPAMVARMCWAVVRRPVVRVWFGPPVDLSGLCASRWEDATVATDRIMDAVTAGLVGLRGEEPRLPRYVDPTRPLSVERSRRRGGQGSGSAV